MRVDTVQKMEHTEEGSSEGRQASDGDANEDAVERDDLLC